MGREGLWNLTENLAVPFISPEQEGDVVGAKGCFRGPKRNGLSTPRGLLARELESFGPDFRAPVTTLRVAFGPQSVSLRNGGSWDGTDFGENSCEKGG